MFTITELCEQYLSLGGQDPAAQRIIDNARATGPDSVYHNREAGDLTRQEIAALAGTDF